MPQLEEANRHVSAQRVNVSWRKRACASGRHKRAAGVLRTMRKNRTQFIDANHVNPVSAIDALLVQMCVIEEEPTEIVRQRNVGIEVKSPAVILPSGHSGIQRGPLIELPSVFAEQVRLDADRAVLLGDLLCAPIIVARHHDHGVQVRVVHAERDVQ